MNKKLILKKQKSCGDDLGLYDYWRLSICAKDISEIPSH